MNDARADNIAVSIDAGLDRRRWRRTLFEALVDGRKVYGGRHGIVAGADGPTLTFDRLVLASLVLGRALAGQTKPGERVGLLLPNVTGIAAAFFALIAFGRVPAMLNFSAGIRSLGIAAETAEIGMVVTSRAFVRQAGLEDAIETLSVNAKIVYLEDVRAGLTWFDKVRGLFDAKRARSLHRRLGIMPDDIAVVLFTSGSEGVAKGVALTHANLLANCEQFLTMLSLTAKDRIFNALPVFHSFGLTIGLLAPIVIGMRTFLYPSPLHYKQIPPLVRQSGATILTGTDTFAAGWARTADAADFAS